HREIPDPRRRLGLGGPPQPTGADPLPGPDRGDRLGVRDSHALPAGAGRLLARQVRLAGAGSTAQRASALPPPDRRPADPLRPRALTPCGRVSVAPDARLARLHRGVPRCPAGPDRPRSARRPGGRCVPRGRALAAGLRLVGAHALPWLGRTASRPRPPPAEAPPRVHPLPRAWP